MRYEKPEWELIVFERNVYMLLSNEGTGEEGGTGQPGVDYSSGNGSVSF